MKEASGKLVLRCPRLGGEIHLSYCLRESAGRPCLRTLQCWQAIPAVWSRLMERLPEEEKKRLLDPVPGDRMSILLDAAKKNREE